MKADKNFKLDKQCKRIAETIIDKQARGAYIKMMVNAQLHAQEAERKPFKMKDRE